MDKTTQDRIKADAEAKYPLAASHTITDGPRAGYIAGATAENKKVQPIIAFLAEVAESDCDYESTNFAKAIHSPECRACKAKELLQQWKGKEVGDG